MMLTLKTSPYFRDLDWEKLKAFYYVAKVGNISRAASFLDLNQSSFSRSIKGLEKHLGYPLFARSKNGVVLTRKGQELFIIVENIFLNMKGFTSRAYASQETTQGPRQKRKIRIAIDHPLAAYLFNSLLLAYHEGHPELIFEVIGINGAFDIILNDVDIAIQLYNPKITKDESMNWQIIPEPLFTIEKKLYASPQYLEKYGQPQTVDDLKNHQLIAPSIPETYPFDDSKWLLELGKEGRKGREPVFLSNSLECLIEAAQQGKGIIGAYGKMTIVQNSIPQNVLPDLILQKRKGYFIYPEYLKEDKDIMDIKLYLKNKMREIM